MVADLVLIALGIARQPFRLPAFILILSTEGGTQKGLGFILGWLTCLVLVIAVVMLITGGKPVRRDVDRGRGWPGHARGVERQEQRHHAVMEVVSGAPVTELALGYGYAASAIRPARPG